MSLYDKASLVLIPSGTKAGKVYSQKPVPSTDVLTDDILNNGDFEQGSSGWTLQEGTPVFSNGNVEFQGYGIINQSVSGNAGETIIVTYTVESADANAKLQLYDGSWFDVEDSVGTHTVSFVSSNFFYLRNNDSGNITLSSVSAKKIVDGDFDFTRSTYATRVNSQGLIEKERSNLLLQSNNFDTTWTTFGTTLTSGQSGYDGSSDAWLVTKTSGIAYQGVRQNISKTGVQTASFYAKAGTLSTIALYISGGSNPYVFVNLTNGTLTAQRGTEIDVNIEDVGSSWYRISFAFDETTSAYWIYPDWSGTNTGNVYIQDAQLEQGLVATDYIETTTSAVYEGITDNVPRLDYDGDCPSLLLEPSRTNDFPESEFLTSKLDADLTQTISDVDSPIKNVKYLKLEKTGGAVARLTPSLTGSGVYTYSAFFKQGSTNGKTAMFGDSYYGTSTLNVQFDLSTGAFTDNTGSGLLDYGFEDFGSGSYRVWATFNYDQVSSGTEVRSPAIYLDNSQLALNEYIYITGIQCEEGSYATSYIPTYGTSVTRIRETARGLFNGDSIFDTDWTAFCELIVPNVGLNLTGAGFVLKSVEGSTLATDRVAVLVHESNSQLELIFYDGTTQEQIQFNYTFGDTLKIAIRNDSAYFVNGTKYTTTMVLQEPVEIGYGRAGQADSSVGETANIKQTLVFPEALTDQECIDLTT